MKTSGLASHLASIYSRLPQTIAKRQAASASATTVRRGAHPDTVLLSREAIAQEKAAFAQKLAAKKAQDPPKNPAQTPPSPTDHGGQIGGGLPAPTVKPKPETPVAASSQSVAPETTEPSDAPAVFGQADLDSVRSSFGARTGDKNYSTQADADGNGVVDFRDLTHVLANWGQTRTK
jgi:hypothetical protein